MAVVDPCSFSNPNECVCTKISWFVDVNFDTHILECIADLTFEAKQDGIKKLVSYTSVKLESGEWFTGDTGTRTTGFYLFKETIKVFAW